MFNIYRQKFWILLIIICVCIIFCDGKNLIDESRTATTTSPEFQNNVSTDVNVNDDSHSGNGDNINNSIAGSVISWRQLLLQSVFDEFDDTKNVLIAPHAIRVLYKQLYGVAGNEDVNGNVKRERDISNENTLYRENDFIVPESISITNILRGVNARDNDDNDLNVLKSMIPINVIEFARQQSTDSSQNTLEHETSERINENINHRSERDNDNNEDDRSDYDHDRNDNTDNHIELLNSVTLHARWIYNFQRRDTHKRPFYSTLHIFSYVDTMSKDDIFPYTVLPELNATALELSFQYNVAKMVIVLPDAIDGLPQLMRKLRNNLHQIDELIAGEKLNLRHEHHRIQTPQFRSTLVRLFMPKIQLTYDMSLNDFFQKLMSASNATRHQLRVEEQAMRIKMPNITQHTHIEVSEDGIRDLMRRTVYFWNAYSSLRSMPVLFDVNHPFLFIIHNHQGIQFIGSVTKI